MEQNITTLNISKLEISKLQSSGINYCSQLTDDLLSSFSVSFPRTLSTKTALEILEEELTDGCILSFNTELDAVLKDEIVPKRIVELAGFPGSGKTQICFQLCITVQLPKSLGGLEGEAVYINTNKNFASHRLKELISKFLSQLTKVNSEIIKQFNEESILKKIYVITCNSLLDLQASVKYLETFLEEKQVKLIVIDSLSNPIRELESVDKTSTIYQLLGNLQILAKTFNFAIVLTNDFTTRVNNNKAYFTPSFGGSLCERVNSRICLSRQKDVHVAELIKSPVKPTSLPLKVAFSIF